MIDAVYNGASVGIKNLALESEPFNLSASGELGGSSAGGIKYDLRKQPDSGVWQLFCFDPSGARVELDFAPEEKAPA